MYLPKNDYVKPSNHRLAHNPTGMLVAILQEKYAGKICVRKNKKTN